MKLTRHELAQQLNVRPQSVNELLRKKRLIATKIKENNQVFYLVELEHISLYLATQHKGKLGNTAWKARKFPPSNLSVRLWQKIAIAGTDDCWLWTAYRDRRGYGKIGNNGSSYLAHRIVFRLVNGDFPEHLKVCHRCDNPSCCNPNHLFLATQYDNVQDRHLKGHDAHFGLKGTAHPLAKLSEEQVREIRKFHKLGVSESKLAIQFSISQSHVSRIIQQKEWQHILD